MSAITYLYGISIVSTILTAVVGVILARGIVRPSHLVRRISHPEAPAIKVARRKIAIDARPMIGEPMGPGNAYRVFGIGHYLRNLTLELAEADSGMDFVLWSSALKHLPPKWFDEFASSHKHVRSIHLKLPNQAIDFAALHGRLKFLEDFIGPVDVSWEVNYFPVRPGDAYSICTVHDLSFETREFRRSRGAYNERSARNAGLADKITTVSEASRRVILDSLQDVSPQKVEVVYGAASRIFEATRAETRIRSVREAYDLPANYFLFAGEAAPRKNLPNLVRAFQVVRVKHPDLHLVMIGLRFEELERLIWSSSDHAELTNVRVLGYVPEHDLPAVYAAGRALVYPSFDEGFGLPIVEAMKSGQIVIASDIPTSREVGLDAPLFVDPHRHESIAQGMFDVLNYAESSRSAKINRGLVVADRFSWQQSAAQMLRLFEEGCRRSR
jgi:glycosyltransferase involved in cell wall biosynthesis